MLFAGPEVRQRQVDSGSDSLPDSLHPVIRRILLARNITDEKSLDLKLGRLQSPAALSGIQQAADILADAVVSGQSILIVGDFDADGATGTAVAVRALKLMAASQVDFRVPNRFEFGYGLSVGLVETLAHKPPDVLVTVDSGISSNEGVARAREMGCKVVVTDHHLLAKCCRMQTPSLIPIAPVISLKARRLLVWVLFFT